MNNSPSFIDEQHAARWLAKFALPFVAASTPEQIRHEANTAYAQNVGKKHLCLCDGTDEPVKKFDFERHAPYQKPTKQELAKLQDLVKTMLTIVLSGKRHDEMPKDIRRQVAGVEKTIKDVFDNAEYCYEWKGKGEASVLREGKSGDSLISRLREWFVSAIVMCLYSLSLAPTAPEIEPMKGEGFDKIGMCPVCGVFFKKIRKNKEHCSERCQQTALMRRVRSKNK